MKERRKEGKKERRKEGKKERRKEGKKEGFFGIAECCGYPQTHI